MWGVVSKESNQSVEKTDKRPIALMGTHRRSLDPKKRLTVPSVWREALGPDLVYVMPDPHQRCLLLIPREAMESRIADLQQRALGDPELNAALAAIGAASESLEFDVQGRIRISDRLLAYANLNGMVELRGSVRMATIWPCVDEPDDMADQVAKLGAAMAKLNF